MTALADWLAPDWRIAGVGALMTTRAGGASRGPYASMNVGSAVGDAPASVAINRARLADAMQARPVFLRQVHGTRVVRVAAADAAAGVAVHEADAVVTTERGVACVVQAADCLPVLLAAPDGRAVGAAHAGWRGLAAGVVEAAVDAVRSAAACAADELTAWLGACIGVDAFEVGADVLVAFGVDPERASARCASLPRQGQRQVARRSGRRSRATDSPLQASRRSAAATGAPSPTRNASSRIGATGRPAAWQRRSGSPPTERRLRRRDPGPAASSDGRRVAHAAGADNHRMARRSERRSEARQPKAPTLQESADRLGAANDGIGTAGGDLADVWKSIAGLGLPAEVLAEAQRDYLVDATAIWNRLLVPGTPHAISDRRFASRRVDRQPCRRRSPPSCTCSMRERCCGSPRRSRATPKTQARLRFAVEQWIDAAAPSNYLALNPEAQKKAIETNGESICQRPAASAGTTCSRAICRRPTRARSRSAATSRRPKARWCSRTSCSS